MKLFALIFVVACVGQSLAYPSPIGSADPEEFGGNFEGDMELDALQMTAVEYPENRNGLINKIYRWADNVIYYEIDKVFSAEHRAHIIKGIDILETVSCLKFRPRTSSSKDYITVTGANTGCHSSVGRRGGKQTLNLQIYTVETGCFRIGTIVHEFLHALGFYHQQSASDRDNFVTIVSANIESGKENNFNKYTSAVVSDFGIKYDYGSVMHYGPTAFSKNGQKTIVTKDANAEIGQRLRLSEADIKKLNLMYNCPTMA